MSRSRSVILAAVAAAMLVGTPPTGASAARPTAQQPTLAPQPDGPAALSPLPDLTSASPLDGGEAVAPRNPVPAQPGGSRLGASAVAPPPLTFSFKTTAYGIYVPPRDKYPYHRTKPVPLVDGGTRDAAGVRMYKIGAKLYDHPVAQAQYGIDNVESFVINDDERYLKRAKAQADRLMAKARKVGNAWFLPYPFDFNLHGRTTDRLAAPWYSGMSQGQALTLFVRLFELTKEQKYKNAADGVFASFLRPRTAGAPWVVWVDAQKHLWLEEYPAKRPDRTLNGHLFATFGMWDYWRLTEDDRAKKLYQGALTTAADYFPSWRNANWISRYCLEHPTVLSEKYHLIHISEFLSMFALSRNITFLRHAETLSRDYPPPTVKGPVHLTAGSYVGVKFTAAGKVSARKTVQILRTSSAPTDRRVRIKGQPGLWYRITAGSLSGFYVQERPGRAYLRGQYVTYEYVPARRVVLAAGKSYTGFAFNADGTVIDKVTTKPTEATSISAVAAAVWNGTEYLLAGTGPLAERWIPRAALGV
jgi:hypothetical protein